jgi:hypothetical protein
MPRSSIKSYVPKVLLKLKSSKLKLKEKLSDSLTRNLRHLEAVWLLNSSSASVTSMLSNSKLEKKTF